LVHPEHVVRIVFTLQCKQTLVFARAVGGADAIRSLVGLLAEASALARAWELDQLADRLENPANDG
jgi:hypothetical protein